MEGWTVRTDEEGWSRREYILATEARIPVIQGTAFAFKLGIQKIAELLWKPSELKQAIAHMRNGAWSSAGTYEASDEEEEDSDKGEAPNATKRKCNSYSKLFLVGSKLYLTQRLGLVQRRCSKPC